MGYPGRHNIYEAAIRRLVEQALQAQEQEFRQLHQDDADEALLQYLIEHSRRLRHTPWPGEITGGSLIQERFGSWQQALKRAGLPEPRMPNNPKAFLRWRQETERQKLVYRQRKAEKKALAEKRVAQQNAKKRANSRER